MQANDADGLRCAACKELMRDDNGNVRTSCLHRCSACRAPLHSTMMCSEVWEPIEHGDQTFCGQACVEAYNAKLIADHSVGLEDDEDDAPPAPDLLPVRRRHDQLAPQPAPQPPRSQPVPQPLRHEGRVLGIGISHGTQPSMTFATQTASRVRSTNSTNAVVVVAQAAEVVEAFT